jgi:glycosidase
MSKYKYSICLVFLSVLSKIVFAYTPSPADWRDQTFYMIMIDRFEVGDTTLENYWGTYDPSNWNGVNGGDLAGITEHLDYLKQLGVTALWISPVPSNGGTSYHGYSATDWLEVDPEKGSLSDLSTLVAQAHARGMYVFLDVVCNHMSTWISQSGSNFNYPDGYSLSWNNGTSRYSPSPFDSLSSFHNYGDIQSYNITDTTQINDTTQVVLGWLDGLNDLRTEDTTVQNALINVAEWWIQQTDCDGFRIDSFYEVNIEFWQAFCPAIRAYAASLGKNNFFMYGEVWNDDQVVGYYTGTQAGGPYVLPSALYYPMYYTITDVFAENQNTSQIDDEYANLVNYDTTTWDYLATFIDNHDNPRFLSQNGNDTAGLQLALAFLLTTRGVPIIYYGTEQGFYGNGSYNREDMFAGQLKDANFEGQDSFNPNYPLYQFTSTLLYIRNNNIPLRRGTFTSRWNNPDSAGIYAYSRIYNGQEMVVILNTATSIESTQSGATGLVTTFPQNTILTNLLDSTDFWVVGANGVGANQLAVTVPPQSFKILSPYVSATTPPTVLYSTPTNGQINVPLSQTISVTFSLPMNQITVQTSSFISPPVPGTFSWNYQMMTFTPSTPLQSNQLYTVTIATSTYSLNSVNLQSPYVFTFTSLLCNGNTPPVISNFTPLNGSTVVNTYAPTIQATLTDSGSGINANTIVMTLDNNFVSPTYNASSGLLSFTPPLYSFLSVGQHTAIIAVQDNCANSAQATTSFYLALSKVMDGNFYPGEWSTTELRLSNDTDTWGADNYIYDLYVSADTQYLYIGVVGQTDITGDNVIGVYVDVPTISTGTDERDYFQNMKAEAYGWDPDFMYATVQMQNDPNFPGGCVRKINSNGTTTLLGTSSTGDCGALSAAYNDNGLGGIEFRIPWSATNGATEYSTIKVGVWLAWAESIPNPSSGLGGGSGDQIGAQVPDSNLLTIGNPWIGVPYQNNIVDISEFWKY